MMRTGIYFCRMAVSYNKCRIDSRWWLGYNNIRVCT